MNVVGKTFRRLATAPRFLYKKDNVQLFTNILSKHTGLKFNIKVDSRTGRFILGKHGGMTIDKFIAEATGVVITSRYTQNVLKSMGKKKNQFILALKKEVPLSFTKKSTKVDDILQETFKNGYEANLKATSVTVNKLFTSSPKFQSFAKKFSKHFIQFSKKNFPKLVLGGTIVGIVSSVVTKIANKNAGCWVIRYDKNGNISHKCKMASCSTDEEKDLCTQYSFQSSSEENVKQRCEDPCFQCDIHNILDNNGNVLGDETRIVCKQYVSIAEAMAEVLDATLDNVSDVLDPKNFYFLKNVFKIIGMTCFAILIIVIICMTVKLFPFSPVAHTIAYSRIT